MFPLRRQPRVELGRPLHAEPLEEFPVHEAGGTGAVAGGREGVELVRIELDGGLTLDEAAAEARTIGLKTAEYEAKARDYVARHPRPKH